MNTQAPEKKSPPVASGAVVVHSIFHTIQGEGPFAGMRAVFVRLAGCNLQCPLCDTEYTDKRAFLQPSLIVERIVTAANDAVPELVVITGGEPFRQDITKLVKALVTAGVIYVQVETNGTLPVPEALPREVFIVCSPKTGSVHKTIAHWPHVAFKYVLQAGDVNVFDGLPRSALEHPAAPILWRPTGGFGKTSTVYLQPADEKDAVKNEANLRAVLDSCMKHGYRAGVQLHKTFGME